MSCNSSYCYFSIIFINACARDAITYISHIESLRSILSSLCHLLLKQMHEPANIFTTDWTAFVRRGRWDQQKLKSPHDLFKHEETKERSIISLAHYLIAFEHILDSRNQVFFFFFYNLLWIFGKQRTEKSLFFSKHFLGLWRIPNNSGKI